MTTAHRHSLANILRFESVLRGILRLDLSTGESLNFTPTGGINTNTARARLTDAIQALLSNKTTLPEFDVEKLRTLRPLFYITTDDLGRVVVSPKTKKEVKDGAIPSLTSAPQESAGVLAVLDPSTPQFLDRLRAFALLLGHRDLAGQIRIRGPFDPPLDDTFTELLAEFDVAVQFDGSDMLMF